MVANSRAPRDGRYIERIGFYNRIRIRYIDSSDLTKGLYWLTKGAQPTDTVRAILSYKGVLYKKHLMSGVKKGAFDDEEAQRRFEKWIAEKESNIRAKKESIENEVDAALKKLLAAETKKKEERAAEIAARNAELAKEAAVDAEAPSEEAEVNEKAAEETAEEPEPTDTEKQENE